MVKSKFVFVSQGDKLLVKFISLGLVLFLLSSACSSSFWFGICIFFHPKTYRNLDVSGQYYQSWLMMGVEGGNVITTCKSDTAKTARNTTKNTIQKTQQITHSRPIYWIRTAANFKISDQSFSYVRPSHWLWGRVCYRGLSSHSSSGGKMIREVLKV